MEVPSTVTAALEDCPVADAVCLEAGAGVGNMTAGLLAAGASHVYAVTNDREHARTVRDRLQNDGGHDSLDRATVLEADLREIPLPDESVDVITAHGLCNVLAPASLAAIAAEVTRVGVAGCHLVVDDYEPLPEDAAVRDLFAVENAVAELAAGSPALTFYPATVLRHLFTGRGWEFLRHRTLLDPVPWTENHVAAHVEATRATARELSDSQSEPLLAKLDRLSSTLDGEAAGTMYSMAFRLR